MFIYTPDQDLNLLECCHSSIHGRLPRLRDALARHDDTSVQKLAHELSETLSPLRVPVLFQLSDEIEHQHEVLKPSEWSQRCEKFCELLERVSNAVDQTLAMG